MIKKDIVDIVFLVLSFILGIIGVSTSNNFLQFFSLVFLIVVWFRTVFDDCFEHSNKDKEDKGDYE